MYLCRLCSSNSLEQAFDFGAQPIVHHLLSEEDGSSNVFNFTLAACNECGLLQMTQFPGPDVLYKNYFTLSSWKPQPHAEILIRIMSKLYGLNECSRIFEVGSNDGGFLELLRLSGFSDICGIEPTEDASAVALAKDLPIINSFYESKNIDSIVERFPDVDCLVSRQVIEHIDNLTDFMTCIRRQLRIGGGLVLEFPDHSMNYEQLDYSFWEEHVNYFTISTIRTLLSLHGFRIVHYETTLFSGKCLMVFAVKEANKKSHVSEVSNEVARVRGYVEGFPKFKKNLKNFLDAKSAAGKIVMYGCGARSCNFINLLDLGGYFTFFIDDQREKQGKFCPGNRIPIVSSEVLSADMSVALGVNAESEANVIKKHHLKDFFSVLPPSRHLPEFWRNFVR